MNEHNGFEHPKMALIRLLRSQGCCQTESPQPEYSSQQKQDDFKLLRYREQLESKLNRQKARINEIPCVLTLAEEIEELTEVTSGLSHQNKERQRLLRKIQINQQENHRQQYPSPKQEKGQWTVSNQNQSLELRQHQRLQAEYTNLLKSLETTNSKNQKLIAKLTNP